MKKLLLLFVLIVLTALRAAASITTINGINYSIKDITRYAAKVTGHTDKMPTSVSIPYDVSFEDEVGVYVVTEIGYEAFYNCSALNSITLSYSIEMIDWYAFSNCDRLYAVIFTEDSRLQTISDYAFRYCSSLQTVNLSYTSELKTIGKYAFQGCKALESIVIRESVTSIGDGALADCEKLEMISCLCSNPPTLGADVFKNCKALSAVIVPEQNMEAYQTAWSAVADKLCSVKDYSKIVIQDVNASAATAKEAVGACILSADVKAGFISRIEGIETEANTALSVAITGMDVKIARDKAIADIRSIVSEMELMVAKLKATADINAKVTGIENSDIIAIANNAKARIEGATTTEEVEAIKNESLAELEIPVKYFKSGKASALGTMGEECEGCPKVEVVKGTDKIILYNPDRVDFKK